MDPKERSEKAKKILHNERFMRGRVFVNRPEQLQKKVAEIDFVEEYIRDLELMLNDHDPLAKEAP